MNKGDYVRTIEGYICKILEIHEEYDDEYLDWNDIHSASIRKSHVVKSSPNIIDLIEVGDYVDGCLVNKIKDGKPYHEDYSDPYYSYYFEDIKSIVTKEQFSSMGYKVESEVK